MKMNSHKPIIFAVCLLMMHSVAAQVDEEAEERDLFSYTLEELLNMEISSAGKFDQNIRDIPASIYVITREDIELNGYMDLEDLLSDVPGLYSLGNAFFQGGHNYGVRGFAASGAFTTVMVLVNGVNQMESFQNGFSTDRITVPVEAISRVEVIRGPMAVIYGSTAFFGVINIITDKVGQSGKENQVLMNGGSLGTYEAFVRLADKEGDFQYAFNGSLSKSEGLDVAYGDLQSNPAVLQNFGLTPEDRTAGQFSMENIHLDFSGKFKNFNFKADLTDRSRGLPGFIPSFDLNEGWHAYINSRNLSAGYKFDLSKKVSIKTNFAHSSNDFMVNNLNVIAPTRHASFRTHSAANEFEVNMSYDITEKLHLTAGVHDRYVHKVNRLVDGTIIFPPRNLTETADDGTPLNTFSVFAQMDYEISEKLRIIAGGRVEQTSNFTYEDHVQMPDTLHAPWVQRMRFDTDIDDLQFAPRVAAIYKVNSTNTLKFMYGKSILRPSFVQLDNKFTENYYAGIDGGSLGFAEMNTLELNFLSLPSSNLSLNISAYYNFMDNLILRTVTAQAAVSVGNYGKVNTIGTEMIVSFRPTTKFRTELSINYQQSDDKTPGFEDVDFSLSPKLLGYFKTSYKFTDNGSIGLRARYVDDMFAEWNIAAPGGGARFGEEAPSYVLLDATARYETPFGIFMNLHISNLLDSEIRYPTMRFTSWANRGMMGFGRRLKFTIGYKF